MIAAIAFVAEQRIRESMERGEFADLPGRGRPLDLDEDANIPEELRMAHKLLKNGGYLDPAEPAMGQVPVHPPASLGDMLRQSPDERGTLRGMLRLQVVEARFREQAGRQARLDGQSEYHESIIRRMTARGGG